MAWLSEATVIEGSKAPALASPPPIAPRVIDPSAHCRVLEDCIDAGTLQVVEDELTPM